MSDLIKVNEMYFDNKREQPVLKLEDGSTRVIHLVPTGNCWAEYWVTPEHRDKSEADAEARDQRRQEEARKYLEAQQSKRWWHL